MRRAEKVTRKTWQGWSRAGHVVWMAGCEMMVRVVVLVMMMDRLNWVGGVAGRLLVDELTTTTTTDNATVGGAVASRTSSAFRLAARAVLVIRVLLHVQRPALRFIYGI